METREKTSTLLDQQEALGLYLEALFLPPEVETDQRVEQVTDVITDTAEKIEVQTQLTVVEETPIVELQDGQPEWAATSFQILFIDIDGMEIALPMDHMNGVRAFPDQITQMPNQAGWVHGVVKIHGKQVQVVDTHALLIPGQNREKTQPKYIVQLGNSGWGLACKLAERSIELPPDEVRWSGNTRKRRWVLGMIKKHLCALIDVEAFIQQLENNPKFT